MENIQEQTTDQSVNIGEEVAKEEQVEKTFTQEQVNGIAAKEAKQAQEKILKDLGIEDFEGAKDGLAKFRQWQESQKSQAEKQTELLASTQKQLDDALAQNKEMEAKYKAITLGVNAESVEDVIVLANRLVADDVPIEKAIEQVLEKYPQFNRSEQTTQVNTPRITVPGNPSASPTKKVDPFQDIMDNYK